MPEHTIKRVYVAGPITGREGYNQSAFELAEELLLDAGYEAVNPHKHAPHKDREFSYYMAKLLKEVCLSDIVALLPGWEDSKGAKLEAYVAIECGIPVKPIKDLL
jgi:nucleoside 2-deoxyribosyltransferase